MKVITRSTYKVITDSTVSDHLPLRSRQQAHAAALETGADDVLAAPFDDAGRDAQAHRPELRIVHALTVIGEVLDILARLLAALGMTAQGANHFIDTALIEFFASFLGPLFADLASDCVDGLGDLEQMAFGVEPMPNSA